ncbi:hypothetical protein [Saccharopolyspora sp. 5N708]|uniref:hypothetical protein n=1 Tax=Saccharopolyspora sp. 5N708 TaxID=3457424 RepID=UPI003FCFBA82
MVRFHFDLTHLADTSDLRVSVQGTEYELEAHGNTTLQAAHDDHPLLSMLDVPLTPDQTPGPGLSHFAEIDDHHLDGDAVGFVHVVRPGPAGVHLDDVIAMGVLLPRDLLHEHYARVLADPGISALPGDDRAVLLNGRLNWLGITAFPSDPAAVVRCLVESQQVITAMSTAGALVAHHPEIASVRPGTVRIVLDDHIQPGAEVNPNQYNAMKLLANEITKAGANWSKTVECTNPKGEKVKSEIKVGEFAAGQQLYTYKLADNVLNAAAAASRGARRTAADDLRLRNKVWTPTPGTSALRREAGTVSTVVVGAASTSTSGGYGLLAESGDVADAVEEAGGTAYHWTIKERTNHHGIDLAKLSIDGSDKFRIDAYNSYLRTLYAGYQLYDANGKPQGNLTTLCSVSATDSLLGVPIPTSPTELKFDMNGATSVELLFGSLGSTDWEKEVSWRGAILTGLWQYGLPIVFMVAGAAFKNSGILKKILKDETLTKAAITFGLPIAGGGVLAGYALGLTKQMLLGLGNFVLSFATTKAAEKLGIYLAAKLGSAAFTKAFGPAGWAMQLITAGINAVDLAVTTGEVLSSPACVRVRITRALDVSLTLKPDPRHGEAGNPGTAVWPSVARRYQVTLQYKDGTNHEVTGSMSATTNNTPIKVSFKKVPAGGKCRIIAGVYSEKGWLAGSWQSDWVDAKPNKNTELDFGEQTITERLVPLAPDTQYVHKQRLVEQSGKLAWQTGDPASTTRKGLDCGDSGTLCDLVGLTINNTGFQLGYAWRASGQNVHPDNRKQPVSNKQLYRVQNISALTDPASRLQTSDLGFTAQPAVAYSPQPNPAKPKEIDQTNFILDPRDGGMHLRQVLLGDGKSGMGLSGNPKSWGRFPLTNIDALAIHPNRMVIGCSWREHKLALLELPSAAVDDNKAPEALVVSGQGLRQGLMQGPKALSVTPDGRILVLESENHRVQAFDTKGNPVPSFTPTEPLFSLNTSDVSSDLDTGKVPAVLESKLIDAGVLSVGAVSDTDAKLTTSLNSGSISPDNAVDIALSVLGIELAFDNDAPTDPQQNTKLTVLKTSESWQITDPRGRAWHISKNDTALTVNERLAQVEVRTEQPGRQWLVIDHDKGQAWRLTPSTAEPGKTLVQTCLSYFPLKQGAISALYLDMAVENRGYIYVLAQLNQGLNSEDYLLDIYGPDGKFVCRTPDKNVTKKPQNIVAGKIAVDEFRNLFALNFEKLARTGQGPQPGLATWEPTPPLFELPLSAQQHLNDKNIGEVAKAFKEKGISLSNDAYVIVKDKEGSWQVKDNTTIYHAYRAGDGIQVYAVPA